jgi:hypothetical protein
MSSVYKESKKCEFYTFGEHVDPSTLKLDIHHNIHQEGATLLDHNGKNKQIRECIQREIESYLTRQAVVRVGIQCQHGLHRSVEMTQDLLIYFCHMRVSCVHYDANP